MDLIWNRNYYLALINYRRLLSLLFETSTYKPQNTEHNCDQSELIHLQWTSCAKEGRGPHGAPWGPRCLPTAVTVRPQQSGRRQAHLTWGSFSVHLLSSYYPTVQYQCPCQEGTWELKRIKGRCLNCAIQNITGTIKKTDADKSRSKREACISWKASGANFWTAFAWVGAKHILTLNLKHVLRNTVSQVRCLPIANVTAHLPCAGSASQCFTWSNASNSYNPMSLLL